jgi:hypothetical protein
MVFSRLYWVNYKANFFEQLGYWFDVILLAAAAFSYVSRADWKVAYKIDTLVYVHFGNIYGDFEGVLLKLAWLSSNNLDMKTTTPYQNQKRKL